MKAMIELVVGDLDEKRTYHQINKRAKKLPGNYYRAFKKIRNYLYNYGENCADSEVFLELLDLLEECAALKKSISEIVGTDVANFCDELILAANATRKTTRDKLNQEIEGYFKSRRER